MSFAPVEDHTAFDQNMASLQAVDNTDFDQISLCYSHYSVASIYRTSFHIEHLQSCAINIPIVDRLVAKLFPRSRKITWRSTSDGTHSFSYRKASAPWRMNCPACGVIADAMRFFWQDEKLKARSYGWSDTQCLFNTQYPADDEHLQFFTKLGNQSLSLSIERNPFVASEDRFTHLAIRNTLSGNFSEEAICWANECIDRCNQEHPMCSSSSKTARLPTRVLDLEVGLSHNGVRLADMQGKSGRYICLSHCWGKSHKKFLTTKANLEANKASIPVDQLPPSIQDAIAVTRKFGVRYLWIDSLCIVQDSVEDWSHEAAQMASTYENSFLTIGATSTESDEEAFLYPLNTHLKLQVKTLEGTSQDLYVQPAGRRKDLLPEYQPLLRRAWCYQERLLSSRMLHFTRRELWWECRGNFDCECGDKLSHYGERTMMEEKPRIYTHLAQPRLWRQIVENYSDLNLTLDKDKLLALSGLAQRAQELRKDKYLAGLWSRTLVDDLCWKTSSPKGQLQEWRAPSWSWASVNGQVSWDETTLSPQDVFVSDGIYAADVDVIACEIVSIQEDQLGGVKSGFLTIRGKLSPAALNLTEYKDEPPRNELNTRLNRICKRLSGASPQNEEHTKHQHFHVEVPSSSIFSAPFTPFVFHSDNSIGCDLGNITGRLFKLRMYRNTRNTTVTTEIFGASRCLIGYMILRCVADGSTKYERIGWASFEASLIEDTAFSEFLDGETEEVITII